MNTFVFRRAVARAAASFALLLVGCRESHTPVEPPHETIVIGAILPLSGEMAKYGKTSLAALQIAIEDANKTAGPRTFRLIPEDDHLTASVGVAAARKLLDVDRARFIIGAWPSSVTGAVIPVTDAAGAVLVSPASSAPELSSQKGLFFRTCASDLIEGKAAADYAVNTLKARRLAILYIRNDFGQGLLRVFRDTATKAGVEIVMTDSFDLGTADFRVLLAKLAAATPDAVYIVGYREMVPLFHQAREMKVPTRWIGTTMLNDPDMVHQLQGAGDGVVFPSLDFNPDLPDPSFQTFRRRIKETTGGLDVDVFAANAYDAASLVTTAVRAVGPDPLAVAKYLHGPRTYPGTWGAFTLDGQGIAQRRIVYKRISAGLIAPDDGRKSQSR
jgi:branched-chain amino acid transport system substrate-binding protein